MCKWVAMSCKVCRYVVVALLSAVGVCVSGQERAFSGCGGGMMVHAGYMAGSNTEAPVPLQGVLFGLGGQMNVTLWRHWRIGAEGSVSTLNSQCTKFRGQLADGSYIRNGYGGLQTDAIWQCGRVMPFAGATIGGGAMQTLMILDGSKNDWKAEKNTVFNRQGYFFAMPYLGMEYVATKAIHLTFRVDWQAAIHKGRLLFPTATNARIGILFCH